MTVVDTVAKEFQMEPEELLQESLKTYLNQKLLKVESDIFILAKKHGVKNVLELDSIAKIGLVKEEDTYDDYFILDGLEAEREKIKELLGKI